MAGKPSLETFVKNIHLTAWGSFKNLQFNVGGSRGIQKYIYIFLNPLLRDSGFSEISEIFFENIVLSTISILYMVFENILKTSTF